MPPCSCPPASSSLDPSVQWRWGGASASSPVSARSAHGSSKRRPCCCSCSLLLHRRILLNDRTLCIDRGRASNNHCSLLNNTHRGNARISNPVTVFAVCQLLTEGFKGTSWITLLLQSTEIMFYSLKANSPAPAAATVSFACSQKQRNETLREWDVDISLSLLERLSLEVIVSFPRLTLVKHFHKPTFSYWLHPKLLTKMLFSFVFFLNKNLAFYW